MDAAGIEKKPSALKEALGSTSLKIDDLDGELQFTIHRRSGWLGQVVIACAVSAFATYGILKGQFMPLLFAAIAATSAILNWMRGPDTTLRVSANRILATGNLKRWSDSDFTINAVDVKSIGWSSGGRNRSSGIYVWHGMLGFGATCVLPGLSKAKSLQVTDAIHARFPQYEISNRLSTMIELDFDS